MSNQLDTLVRMVNQIAANNSVYDMDEAAQRIAEHLKKFWAPSMKKSILNYANEHKNELTPVTALALQKLGQSYQK